METKEKILSAALKLFIEKGFNETPTSLISKEAGVATGTLFHHFETKEALINSLYLHCKDRLVSFVMNEVDQQPTYRAKVRRLWENFILWGMKHSLDYQLFVQYNHSKYITGMTHETGSAIFSGVTKLIQEGIEQELTKKMDLEFLMSMVSSVTMTQVQYFIDNPDKYEDKDFRDSGFQFFMG